MTDFGSEYRKNFRENLKSFRLNRGLTQAELALRANYDSTYVGKLERGASSPSFDTIIRLGEALEIYPLKLLRPSRAHLDIREEIPEKELTDLPYNPLDVQIFDSLPFAMGIITDEGTPVYVNDSFVNHTGIRRDDIKEQKLWELSCWNFDGGDPDDIIDSIERVKFEDSYVHYKLGLDSEDEFSINLFFYPTPINYDPGEEMMWIFEFRHPEHTSIDFPIEVTSISKVKVNT